ncbi:MULTISPECIES: hypothetical protein [unclassified Halomonas]|uniref:DUF7940 domain-containing protein n=1 Tax=unclassified Halomonas TaxID=2609666 RepID=UPI0020767698|nr:MULTISPECIES: hypothetical protein [unclassified Halomonas]
MKKPQLADDAHVWHRLWSNHAAILSAVTTAQALLPFWDGIIADRYFVLAGAMLSSAAVILRSLKQSVTDRPRHAGKATE